MNAVGFETELAGALSNQTILMKASFVAFAAAGLVHFVAHLIFKNAQNQTTSSRVLTAGSILTGFAISKSLVSAATLVSFTADQAWKWAAFSRIGNAVLVGYLGPWFVDLTRVLAAAFGAGFVYMRYSQARAARSLDAERRAWLNERPAELNDARNQRVAALNG